MFRKMRAALVCVCMAIVVTALSSGVALAMGTDTVPSSDGVTNPAASIKLDNPRDVNFFIYKYEGTESLTFPTNYDYYNMTHDMSFTLVGEDPTKPCDDKIAVTSRNTCNAIVSAQDAEKHTCTIIRGNYSGPVTFAAITSSGKSLVFKVTSVLIPAAVTVSQPTLTLQQGAGKIITTNHGDNVWSSSNDKVATVNNAGLVKAVAPGTTEITATYSQFGLNMSASCTVTVPGKSDGPKVGTKKTIGKVVYQVTGSNTVAYCKCKATGTSVKIPASVSINGRSYKVTKVAAKAFAGTKVTSVTVASKSISSFKNAFKGSKVKTVKVPSSKKAAYKKLLKAGACGKSVTVK